MNKLSLSILYILLFLNFLAFLTPRKVIETEYVIIEPLPKQVEIKEQKLEMSQAYKSKAFELVNKYIGKKGQCYQIAMDYIKELKGLNETEKERINENEVITGDLIYYYSNGLGSVHYAVYLDTEIALHGNWNGTTILGKVNYEKFSKPIYYRIKEKKNVEKN